MHTLPRPVTTNDQTQVEPHTQPTNQGLGSTPLASTYLPSFFLCSHYPSPRRSFVLPQPTPVTLHLFFSTLFWLRAPSLFSLLPFLVSVSGGGQGEGSGVFRLSVVVSGCLAFPQNSPHFFCTCFVCCRFKCLLGQGHVHLTLNCFQWASEFLAWEQPPTGVNIGVWMDEWEAFTECSGALWRCWNVPTRQQGPCGGSPPALPEFVGHYQLSLALCMSKTASCW